MRGRLLFAILCWGAAAATALAANVPALGDFAGEWQHRPIARGVDLFQANGELAGVPQIISILRLDLDQPGVSFRFRSTTPGLERRKALVEFALEAGAIAAINGGFSHGRGFSNSGIVKIDDAVLPFARQEADDLRFAGASAIGLDDDDRVIFFNRPGDTWPEDWPEARHALAGGYRLLENGAIHPSLDTAYHVRENRHIYGRHPRTAVGKDTGNVLYFVTVDGRHSGRAHGVTLHELARLLGDLGCTDAINLEGGGSTTLWTRPDGVVNYPSDNLTFDHDGTRRLRSAILIFVDEAFAANRFGSD